MISLKQSCNFSNKHSNQACFSHWCVASGAVTEESLICSNGVLNTEITQGRKR
jgi:hypothetical protein